jgi:hypothetical protein
MQTVYEINENELRQIISEAIRVNKSIPDGEYDVQFIATPRHPLMQEGPPIFSVRVTQK